MNFGNNNTNVNLPFISLAHKDFGHFYGKFFTC